MSYDKQLPPPYNPNLGPQYRPAPDAPLMPMPVLDADPTHNQPSYVTNIYYQQPGSEPISDVNVVKAPSVIEWVSCGPVEAPAYSQKAVVAGTDKRDGPMWIIRAYHSSGDLLPGKLLAKHRKAFISFCCKEIPVHHVELLCAPPDAVRWVREKNGQLPAGAIQAGRTKIGEPLYIGRSRYKQTPGKVHPSHGCLYTSKKGKEVTHKKYEVLCRAID